MSELQTSSTMVEARTEAPPSVGRRAGSRMLGMVSGALPALVALAFVVGLVALGLSTGWELPSFSELIGDEKAGKEDWCAEHHVRESECVECNKALMPPGPDYGWCALHGTHDCPLCHPDVAQLPYTPIVSKDDLARAARGLAFAPRAENNSKCKLYQRRIQISSAAEVARLGIEVEPATRAGVTEALVANGEIVYDPTRVARLSARAVGTVWRVDKQLGDPVRRGEVLALVDCADVGHAKAQFAQALTQRRLKEQIAARLQGMTGGGVSLQQLRDADAALQDARVRVLTAEQALINLGIAVPAELKDLPLAPLAERLQFLGLPEALAGTLDARAASANLVAVVSPFDGEVVERSVVAGEQADPAKVLFVVADPKRMWLLLNVRPEDADRVKPGLAVQFQPGESISAATGTVAWVSPAADDKSRTVPVRVDLPNPLRRHRARTFGSARVIVRAEPAALVVPNDAIHWEGDCHVVFVRDKHFDEPGAPKVFQVRTVRLGAKNGPMTEIIAGLLPGELVATQGSGILRAELLKNNLGEGCACCH